MKVNYVFADGREQVCTLPLGFPLSLIPTLMDNREQGLIAIEILSVGG